MNFLKTLQTTGTVRILNASSDRRYEAAAEITLRFQVCTSKASLVEKFHTVWIKKPGSFYLSLGLWKMLWNQQTNPSVKTHLLNDNLLYKHFCYLQQFFETVIPFITKQ